MAFENILVVCVGNICRSPMAEALLKQRFPEKNIDSAGVGALVGHAADAAASASCVSHMLIGVAPQVSSVVLKLWLKIKILMPSFVWAV